MIRVYGIKNCGSVRKALKFFEEIGKEVEFVDIRKNPQDCQKINRWVDKVGIETLFNNKGTKYRQLKLKELNLDDKGKIEWLCKENMLIKRPVVEFEDDEVIVEFDEDKYKEIFVK